MCVTIEILKLAIEINKSQDIQSASHVIAIADKLLKWHLKNERYNEKN